MLKRTMSAVVVAGLAHSAMAEEFYRQDPVLSCGGLSSQDARNPGGLGWFSEVADNFTALDDWNIDEVHFWGGYCVSEDQKGNTEGFTIRFYEDAGGMPGVRVYEEDVFSFTEEVYHVNGAGFAGYFYTLDLPAGFEAVAGGEYWISVVAILPRGGGVDEPQWGWVAAQGLNPPPAHQWFFDPGNFQPQGNDVAYVLLGGGGGGCPADLDGDGDADVNDFFLYLDLFEAGDPRADITGDGEVDVNDFFAYLDLFEQGC